MSNWFWIVGKDVNVKMPAVKDIDGTVATVSKISGTPAQDLDVYQQNGRYQWKLCWHTAQILK